MPAPAKYYGIVDCNSFYCSCERLFNPALDHKPVVVLSNNDGCIVARSDEAKAFGVAMAGPYFKAKPLIQQHGVAVFSSNYNLYGDLSHRVMETLRHVVGKHNVEVYSVDEAFIDLSIFPVDALHHIATQLKHTVELWTGIKVSVGVAPTKVLSKLANRLAKKNKAKTNCVVVLHTEAIIAAALQRTPIADVWGIGSQYARTLKETFNIYTAYDLSLMSSAFAGKYLGGVVGQRLLRELQGIPSMVMQDELVSKKMIATTRMFGIAVTTLKALEEAIATYASRAAEKLRRQYSAATTITAFVVVKQDAAYGDKYYRGTTASTYTVLPTATSNTSQFIKVAVAMVQQLYKPGNTYKKAGIILSGIVPDDAVQGNLFVPQQHNTHRKLMHTIDNINFSQRNDVLKYATTGTTRNWKMRQELRSKRYTTRWNELYEVQ